MLRFVHAAIAFAVASALAPAVVASPPDPDLTALSGQVELARLVDLCAGRLGLNIEYDAATLRGTVTLRLGAGVTDQELWTLTNRLLAVRGFTSVRMPGESMLSIVKVADAAGMARVEMGDDPIQSAQELEQNAPGFVTAVFRAQHQPIRDLLPILKLVMSRTGSSAVPLGESGMVLLSDVRPRLEEALRLLEMVDVPFDQPVVTTVATEHLAAAQVASLATSTMAARDSLAVKPMRGRLQVVPDGTAIVIVAPASEIEQWRELLKRLDQREAVEARLYTVRHQSPAEVARLIEQTVRPTGSRGSAERWRIVQDDLTGTLFVTATSSEHAQIEQALQRLNELPIESRQPVRTFTIRNRSARELAETLLRLIDAGVLEASSLETDSAPSGLTRVPQPVTVNAAEHGDTAATPAESTTKVATPALEARDRPRKEGRRINLTVDEGTNSLIAIGDSQLLAQVERLIRQIDIRQPQVLIETLALNLTESDSFELGVELRKLEVSGETLIGLSSLFGLSSASNLTALPAPGRGFSGAVLSPGDFSVLIRALQSLNRGRSVSMPRALVNNNQQATLDSVLQQPFTTLASIDQVTTTSLGGMLDAGTVLTIKPQIAERDHLVLEYSLTISSFVGESADPRLPPPRQQNRLQSVVTIPEGYVIVVGGIELKSEATGTSQIPLLGDIPLIGEAFKSRSISNNRSRFFVFIRADVLRSATFEDIKFLGEQAAHQLEVEDGWPTVQPRLIQ